MRKFLVSLAAAALAALLFSSVMAATPDHGTATLANDAAHPLTYTAGPFTFANSFGSSIASECSPGYQLADCDVFNLSVTLPAGYETTHPGDSVHVRIDWTLAAARFDLYVYDNDDGSWTPFPTTSPVAQSNRDATTYQEAEVPARGGTHRYVVQVSTTNPAGDSFSGKIWVAQAVAAQSGTVTPANDAQHPLTYEAGPFHYPNSFGNTIPGECDPSTAEVPCHVYSLTADLPADFSQTHPGSSLFVRIDWGTPAARFDLYLYDNDDGGWTAFPSKTPIAKSTQDATTFQQIEVPPRDGRHKYIVQVSTTNPADQGFTGKIWVTTSSPGHAPVLSAGNASGIAPRFLPYIPTDADGSPSESLGLFAAEPTIFASPKSGNLFYQGLYEVLRLTFDDSTSPAKVKWEFKDTPASISSKASVDPLLLGDPVTNRIWAMQLAGGQSVTDYSDDNGETWTPTLSGGFGSGADHQGMGVGPYPATGSGSLVQHPLYPNALYYCSQDVATAFCSRSDDGGSTWGPIVTVYNSATSKCVGLHGHPKVAPDGTVYLPNKGCGLDTPVVGQGQVSAVVSEDAGVTWTVRPVSDSSGGLTDKGDPSVGVDAANTMYLAYTNLNDDHLYVAISKDHGQTYAPSQDVGALAGVTHSVFPAAVAGDAGRVAVAFFGTPYTGGGDPTSMAFQGVWYLYVATTYDGGQTWFVTNATPNDPIQSVGGIGNGGDNRNHYDFIDAGIDAQGRIYASNSIGCTASCPHNGGPNTFAKLVGIVRQSGGRRLYAKYDPVEPALPAAPLLNGVRTKHVVTLNWPEPDGSGVVVTGYNVYRGINGGAESRIASAVTSRQLVDPADPANTYAYRVTALTSVGEGASSNVFTPTVGQNAPTPDLSCTLPGRIYADRTGEGGTQAANDISGVGVSEPQDQPGKLVFTIQDTQQTPSDSLAYIYFDPSGQGLRYRLEWSKDGTNDIATFKDGQFVGGCGTAGTSDCQDWHSAGALEAGSGVQNDGSFRFVIDKAKLHIKTGDVLLGVEAREDQAQDPSSVITSDFAAGRLDYTVVGNDWCALPVAKLGAVPVSGTSPLAVSFDASGSSTPYAGATLTAYTLDFGDGSAPVTQPTAAFNHTYSAVGTYTATLTVTDSRDKASTNAAKQAITVTAPSGGGTLQPPNAVLVATPVSGVAPLTVSFDASASTTTNAGAHVASYALDFGDGSAPVTQATATFSHVYTTAGSYTASLTVTDSSGQASTNLSQRTINVSAPSSGGGSTPPPATTGGAADIGNSHVGAFGWSSLLSLLGLAALRRRRQR